MWTLSPHEGAKVTFKKWEVNYWKDTSSLLSSIQVYKQSCSIWNPNLKPVASRNGRLYLKKNCWEIFMVMWYFCCNNSAWQIVWSQRRQGNTENHKSTLSSLILWHNFKVKKTITFVYTYIYIYLYPAWHCIVSNYYFSANLWCLEIMVLY